jgi:uncharacterized protein (TIGR02145 family)
VTNVYQTLAGENNPDYKSDNIDFACVAEYADGTFKTASMDILFIGTNTSGYGEHNGVKYLTLQMGKDGTVKGGTMKVALLSLGQSADWDATTKTYTPNNDAGDLGDFYQWGRVADGHQNAVWSKNASHKNQILPFGETLANTSDVVAYKALTAYDANKQIPTDSTAYYGKFITAVSSYWGTSDNSLWGNGVNSRTGAPASLSDWSDIGKNNNPCPSGWYIPSRWNFWDLYRGTGTDTSISSSDYDGTDNTWQWRASNGTYNYTFGGAILTHTTTGEKVFLPASGYRVSSSGALSNAGSYGFYWSSTYYAASIAYNMYFDSGTVYAGSSTLYSKGNGFSARCVAE